MSEDNNNAGAGNNDSGQSNTNNSTDNSTGNNAQSTGNSGDNGNTDQHGDAAQSQESYEKRIAELDKRDKAMSDKLKRMEALNDKITAEGRATGGTPPKESVEEKQKKALIKNFGGCIDGLDKMI